MFCFLRRDGYPNAVILIITNCLTPEKSSCPREGRDPLEGGYLRAFAPCPAALLYQLPTSSLSHTPGCITPIHQPGSGVTSSGSLPWPILVGLGACIRHRCSIRSLGFLYYFRYPTVFLSECFCFLQPTPAILLQGRCPGPPGSGMVGSGDACACPHSSP